MSKEYLFQFYLVVFLDLLGQKESLRRIKILPAGNDGKAEFIDNIKQTLGKVLRIRKNVQHFFDGLHSHLPNVELVAPEKRDQFVASQKYEVSYYGLSDSIVVYVPLMSNDENCSAINGIYSSLVATSCIGLIALSEKMPIRGGIDVGIAAQIGEREIYGPALERAIYLENSIAEYPRFVIGDELLSYLEGVRDQKTTSIMGKIASEGANFCREMIIRDEDNSYMLDFIGPKLMEAVGDTMNKEMVLAAYEFIKSEYSKYGTQDNKKLAPRYYKLLRYFEYRIDIWK